MQLRNGKNIPTRDTTATKTAPKTPKVSVPVDPYYAKTYNVETYEALRIDYLNWLLKEFEVGCESVKSNLKFESKRMDEVLEKMEIELEKEFYMNKSFITYVEQAIPSTFYGVWQLRDRMLEAIMEREMGNVSELEIMDTVREIAIFAKQLLEEYLALF